MKTSIKAIVFFILFFATTITISAQNNSAYTTAINEIKEQFGAVPVMFEALPKHALAGAWDNFKELNGPNSKIPAKYRELIQLAVAAQIPCDYCIYYHTTIAKASGASEEEIKEAIAHGAATRQWSMILQGTQIDFKTFKIEFDSMLKYMSEKPKK